MFTSRVTLGRPACPPCPAPYLSQLVQEEGTGAGVAGELWARAVVSAVASVQLRVDGWLFKERKGACSPSSPERLLHS